MSGGRLCLIGPQLAVRLSLRWRCAPTDLRVFRAPVPRSVRDARHDLLVAVRALNDLVGTSSGEGVSIV